MTDLHKYHAHGLNVGLGVQSTATALMCINGDLPKPDFFIFADTGWEREGTYENLQRLKPIAEKAGIPFHVVENGNIRENQMDAAIARTELPYYANPSRFETIEGKRELLIKDIKKAHRKESKNSDMLFDVASLEDMLEIALIDFDDKVASGLIRAGYMEMSVTRLGRQCTEKYKIAPVNEYCRKHYGAHFKNPVGTWLGISTDEWTRMAVSKVKAFVLFYPLIDMGFSRQDCIKYMEDHDYEVPVKSSCIGCPFHSNSLWKDMSDSEIADAGELEAGVNAIIESTPSLKDRPYFANGVRLHESMIPITERPFDKTDNTDDLERDGVCGQAGCFL